MNYHIKRTNLETRKPEIISVPVYMIERTPGRIARDHLLDFLYAIGHPLETFRECHKRFREYFNGEKELERLKDRINPSR